MFLADTIWDGHNVMCSRCLVCHYAYLHIADYDIINVLLIACFLPMFS